MKRHLITSVLYTLITAVLLGLVYPLVVTGLAHVLFPAKADGQLIYSAGNKPVLIGSKLIGQPFTGAKYFHSRPSAAGTGYDAAASSGSNLGPTSQALIDRVKASVKTERTGAPDSQGPVPIDLVTTSASGLDPDITPAAAAYQVPRIAKERALTEDQLRTLIAAHTTGRDLGILGEPQVHVLELNLALDALKP